jgi:acetyl-CoA carboxylase carboxyltransferase component
MSSQDGHERRRYQGIFSTDTTKSEVLAYGSFANADAAVFKRYAPSFGFLPASNEKGTTPIKKITDPGDPLVPGIEPLVPDDPNTPYDVKDVIQLRELFEIMPVRRKQMTTMLLLWSL